MLQCLCTICLNEVKFLKKVTGSLGNYYKVEPKYGAVDNGNEKITISFTDSKSFIYKTKIVAELNGDENRKNDIEIVVPLKHLSNFWRTLNIPLINCQLSLILTWFKNCMITTRAYREQIIGTGTDKNPQISEVNSPSKCTFK